MKFPFADRHGQRPVIRHDITPAERTETMEEEGLA